MFLTTSLVTVLGIELHRKKKAFSRQEKKVKGNNPSVLHGGKEALLIFFSFLKHTQSRG